MWSSRLGSLFAILAVLLVVVNDNGASARKTRSVVEIDASQWETISKEKDWFVMFYAPWCPFCKKMDPAWQKVGSKLIRDDDINVGRLDCGDAGAKALCYELGITGFPTVQYFSEGIAYDFKTSQKAEDMVNFARSLGEPATTWVEKEADLFSATGRTEKSVFYFAGADDSERWETWRKVSMEKRLISTFVASKSNFLDTDDTTTTKTTTTTTTTPTLYNIKDRDVYSRYDGEWTSDALAAWVQLKHPALFPMFDKTSIRPYRGSVTMMLAIDLKSPRATKLLAMARTVAKRWTDKTPFGYFDNQSGDMASFFKRKYDVEFTSDTFVLWDHDEHQYYINNTVRTEKELDDLLENFHAGRLPLKGGLRWWPYLMRTYRKYTHTTAMWVVSHPVESIVSVVVLALIGCYYFIKLATTAGVDEDGEKEKEE
eukprot:TRINITY_DN1017_c3_g1_i1.p1 TRINITY_DN1017_c3_g1~~TRINITY_DN1017_c3_g1_i1.p1  ORF type:complete len:438 (-),score=114.21 TRINITY_DN1017_c3_g1_i1:80-1363(-)